MGASISCRIFSTRHREIAEDEYTAAAGTKSYITRSQFLEWKCDWTRSLKACMQLLFYKKSNLPFTQLCAYVSWVIGLNYSIIWEMNFIIIHSLKAYMQLLFFKNNLPFTQLCACVSWVIITQLYKRNGLRNNSRLWKQQKRGKYFISVLKERRNIPVASAHFRCSAFAAFRSLNTFCSN